MNLRHNSTEPRLRRLGLHGSVLASLVLAILPACRTEPLTHIPYEIALSYRRAHPSRLLRPGWRLIEVARPADRPTVIVHRVLVIPELAGDLVLMGNRKRRGIVGGVACPPADHSIWQQLSSRQDIEVELTTERGAFSTISCRRAVF